MNWYLTEKAPAKYVPAAAVIRMVQGYSGFTGCKGSAGGTASLMRKPGLNPGTALETVGLECRRGKWNS